LQLDYIQQHENDVLLPANMITDEIDELLLSNTNIEHSSSYGLLNPLSMVVEIIHHETLSTNQGNQVW
jgi:hypothetical protein